MSKIMKCVICGSEDVPVIINDKDATETYLSKDQIPFHIGKSLFRIRIYYPTEKILCKEHRKSLVLKGFGIIE